MHIPIYFKDDNDSFYGWMSQEEIENLDVLHSSGEYRFCVNSYGTFYERKDTINGIMWIIIENKAAIAMRLFRFQYHGGNKHAVKIMNRFKLMKGQKNV